MGITPEREYLIAMEFFDDAVEVGEAAVDEQPVVETLTATCPPAAGDIRSLEIEGGCVSYHTSIPDGSGIILTTPIPS